MRKKLVYLSVVLFTVLSTSASAENGQEVVYIKSVKFVTPLLKQWGAEYSKAHPGVQIVVAEKESEAKEVDIQLVVSESQKDESFVGQFYSAVGRYAVLPIAGTNNVLLDDLQKKRLNAKRLKELFFEKDLLSEDYLPEKEKEKYDVTIYSGNHATSVSNTFAFHFGRELTSLRGKKIAGDDIYLVNAIQKDNRGVSINHLSYIYDTGSRQLKSGIAILPLDVKKEYAEVLEGSDLDQLIRLLENKPIDLIPVEEISFVTPNNVNPTIKDFLRWVLSEGQSYNHQFGFLTLDEKTLTQQKKQLETRLLTAAYNN
jgi:ABC-type phosphate transport system substrate-binding protein